MVWTCDLADEAKTKVVGSVEGEITFNEISNDEEDWEYEVSIQKGDETLTPEVEVKDLTRAASSTPAALAAVTTPIILALLAGG